MSTTNFVGTVTHVPADWANDVDRLVYDIFSAAQTLADVRDRLGLKSLASQDSSNVSITGGSLDGVSIGVNVALPQVIADRVQINEDAIDETDAVNLRSLSSYLTQNVEKVAASFRRGFGTLVSQNSSNVSISGGTLDGVDIGMGTPGSARFATLKVSTPPADGDDVVTLGWITQHVDVKLDGVRSMAGQDSDSVSITGGEIDGVRIGATTPVQIRAKSGTVIVAPKNNEDITNKRYVDSSISEFAQSLGSMAEQESDAVSVSGGTINGVNIGSSSAGTGRFSSLVVSENQAMLGLRTTSTGVDNQAGLVFQDGAVVASLIYRGAGASVNPSTLNLASSVPITINTPNCNIILGTTNVNIQGPIVNIGAATGNRTVIGSGTPVDGAVLTVNDSAYMRSLELRRAYIRGNVAKKVSYLHANPSAHGTLTIDVNAEPVWEVRADGEIAFVLTNDDNAWFANSYRTIEINLYHNTAGARKVFPSNVIWGGGIAPDYTATKAGDFDIVRLHSRDGVTWLGESVYGAGMGYSGLPKVVFMSSTAGGTSRLSWNVLNAVTVHIGNIGFVPANGTIEFANPPNGTIYELTAVGRDGRVTASSVTL